MSGQGFNPRTRMGCDLPDGVFFTCYKEAVNNNAEELMDIMGLCKKK